MAWFVFLLFVLVPVAEIALLIQLGSLMGTWPTVALVLTTGALGAWLARREGRRILDAWRAAMQRGALPNDGLTDGLLVVIGATLLLTPGLITDVVGFALLVPWSRHRLREPVARALHARIQSRVVTSSGPRPQPVPPDVIDVQARVR